MSLLDTFLDQHKEYQIKVIQQILDNDDPDYIFSHHHYTQASLLLAHIKGCNIFPLTLKCNYCKKMYDIWLYHKKKHACQGCLFCNFCKTYPKSDLLISGIYKNSRCTFCL